MGKRPVARQTSRLWVETADRPTSDGHPFFSESGSGGLRVRRLRGVRGVLRGVDGRSLRRGRYFRMLLIGYFEGLSSERGIAWRVADSLTLRSFLDLELTGSAPDHSTLWRTGGLIEVETHEAVFTWVLERLSEAGLVVGKTVGIDATTLEANAAMRSIERRDTGESYEEFRSAVGCWRVRGSAEVWSCADHKMLWCRRHRQTDSQTDSVRVCSPASRRVAPRRPRLLRGTQLRPHSTGVFGCRSAQFHVSSHTWLAHRVADCVATRRRRLTGSPPTGARWEDLRPRSRRQPAGS